MKYNLNNIKSLINIESLTVNITPDNDSIKSIESMLATLVADDASTCTSTSTPAESFDPSNEKYAVKPVDLAAINFTNLIEDLAVVRSLLTGDLNNKDVEFPYNDAVRLRAALRPLLCRPCGLPGSLGYFLMAETIKDLDTVVNRGPDFKYR